MKGGKVKDFYHFFGSILGHRKNATSLPSPSLWHVFLEFLEYTYMAGKIRFSGERKSKLLNVVHLILLYLHL